MVSKNYKITKLTLNNFRSYESLKLDFTDYKNIVITGKNGAGKTNILEAISILSVGNGFRKSKLNDIGKADVKETKDIPTKWSVFAKVLTDDFENDMGSSYEYLVNKEIKGAKADKRNIVINSKKISNQSELLDYIRIAFITPYMDRIFVESGADRRKFFDALILSFNKEYSNILTEYNFALKQRSKLLKQKSYDETWVSVLEKTITESGIAIAAARLEYVAKINKLLENNHSNFPNLKLILDGQIEEKLMNSSALATEDYFKELLKENRKSYEKLFSPPTPGVHRTDFKAYNLDKKIFTSFCSTGEQKLSIISIILAHSHLSTLNFGKPPVLLIDEATAHLDEKKQKEFFEELLKLDTQIFFTGVDKELFKTLPKDTTLFIEIDKSKVI